MPAALRSRRTEGATRYALLILVVLLAGAGGVVAWVLKANRARMFYEALGGAEIAEKSERLGLHSFAEIAYAWHDLTALVAAEPSTLPGVG